jgi:D-alanyl-D-alanine carboxypeptidase
VKKKVILTAVAVVVLCTVLVLRSHQAAAPSNKTNGNAATNTSNTTANSAAAFNKNLYATTDPASLWMVVNKATPLPSSYVPAGLTATTQGEVVRAETATALNKLVAAAKAGGNDMYVISGYRSYATQVTTYNNYVKTDGQAQADTYSARPGHSEHQTGLAVDLGNGTCDLEVCFGNTGAGKWLVAHAHEYGFIIRYPEGKQAITGYQYEPWHIRYVGTGLAAELHKNGQTMEEFFNVVPPKQPY